MPLNGAEGRIDQGSGCGLRGAMIQVRGLTKIFRQDRRFRELLRREPARQTVAVQDVSFDIDEGEVFGLVGPNGAGKTTLLLMLCTLLVPTSGRATIAGLDLDRDGPGVRRLIGMVASNERSFFWRLTGRQNLRFFADLYQLRTREAERWVGELLELLDLAGSADQRFATYSTGTKQRFAIARGLLHRPRVLLMDEPTKGVDPKSSADIIALVRERIVSEARQTVVITSHNLREIEQLCRRTLIMERGRVAYLGTTADLKRSVMGADAYRIRIERPTPGLLAQLSAICAVPVAEVAPGVLDLRLLPGGSRLDAVMRILVESYCGLRDVTRVEVPIEDAFVALLAGRQSGERPARGELSC